MFFSRTNRIGGLLFALENSWMWLFILLYGISRLQTAIVNADDAVVETIPADKLTAIRKLILEQHNTYRKKHKADPLEEDATLNQLADELAVESAKKEDNVHKNSEEYGENHWKKNGISYDDVMKSAQNNPVGAWYSHWVRYPGYFSNHAAHLFEPFTQLVWKSTKKLGCGVSRSSDTVYVACLYQPKGNPPQDTHEESQYPKNVDEADGQKWLPEADNSLSWWFVLLIFICVGGIAGWRVYGRGRRGRRRSSVRPGAFKPGIGAKPGIGVKPGIGAKPGIGVKPGARAAASAKPAARAKPATSKPATSKPATTKPATTKPAATTKP